MVGDALDKKIGVALESSITTTRTGLGVSYREIGVTWVRHKTVFISLYVA